MSDEMQVAWEKKYGHHNQDDKVTDQHYYFSSAGIYAEFGKVICISCGFFIEDKESGKLLFRIKSFADENEEKLLQGFVDLLNMYYNKPDYHRLTGHNIKEFDVPYLCRRLLINGFRLPRLLDIAGRKPWETKFIDTLELWKFGDYKNYTSLHLLSTLFKIPTSKDDIDGSDVGHVYYHKNDLPRIVRYCQKDVQAVAQLMLRFKGMPLLSDDEVVVV